MLHWYLKPIANATKQIFINHFFSGQQTCECYKVPPQLLVWGGVRKRCGLRPRLRLRNGGNFVFLRWKQDERQSTIGEIHEFPTRLETPYIDHTYFFSSDFGLCI